MTKGLKILLPILALSVLALAGTYYLSQRTTSPGGVSPTNEETPTNGEVSECEPTGTKEGWCLYENKELGFSFEYPKTWGTVSYSLRDES